MEEEDKLQKKVITIDSWEMKPTKIGDKFSIKSTDGEKFEFFKNKRDGGMTKAAEWAQERIMNLNGLTICAVFKSKPRAYDFVGKDGNRVQGTTTDNTVMWFEEETGNVQPQAPAESMSAGALKALNAKVNDIDQRLKKLEGTPMSVASVNASMSEPHASDDIPPEYDVSDIPF